MTGDTTKGPAHQTVCGPLLSVWLSGPAGADRAVGAGHVAAGGLHLLPVEVGLLVDHLEVTAQVGDELLARRRPGTAPEVPGSKHIANDGLVLLLQGSGLRANEGAVGVDIAELVVNGHCLHPPKV